MITVLLATLVLLQDKAAEEEFRKFEESLRTATSLTLRYRAEGTVTENKKTFKLTAEGTLHLKGEGKALFRNKAFLDGKNEILEGVLVSDGLKGHTSFSDRGPSDLVETPKNLRERLIGTPARVGIVGFLVLNKAAERRKSLRGPLLPDLSKAGRIADLTLTQEGEHRVLKYRFVPSSTEDYPEMDITLTLGAGAKPVKRVVSLKGRGDSGSYTETYDEFVLNGDLADETFATPLEAAKKSVETSQKRLTASTQLTKIRTAIAIYEVDTGRYPPDLGALVKMPDGLKGWKGPYLAADVPKDPWGNPYGYRFPGKRRPESYDLFSNGPDGKPDTDDDLEPL